MPSYVYKAKKDATHTINGQINASDEEEALELIHQMGLIPVSIAEGNAQGTLVSSIRPSKIKSRDIYLLTKQLAGLIKSGVPLLKALEVIAEQSKNPYLAQVLNEVSIGVKSGRSLSVCLNDYPDIFSPLFVAMIRAGEEMGRLKEMLHSITDFLKKQDEFAGKVRGALVYPSLMFAVGLLTVIFILTFVMPKMIVIFTDSKQVLPLPTIIVIGLSNFFQKFWIPFILTIVVAATTFARWRKTTQGSWAIGRILLKTPWVRDFILKADLTRFSRTMHLLLASGLPIMRSIEVSVPTIHNPQLREDLLGCVKGLAGGENLGQCLAKSDLIPPLMVQLITIGEESGSLHESLDDIAQAYESDVEEATKAMTTLFEPLMILAVGAAVGLIVFAMLLPIFSMDIMAR